MVSPIDRPRRTHPLPDVRYYSDIFGFYTVNASIVWRLSFPRTGLQSECGLSFYILPSEPGPNGPTSRTTPTSLRKPLANAYPTYVQCIHASTYCTVYRDFSLARITDAPFSPGPHPTWNLISHPNKKTTNPDRPHAASPSILSWLADCSGYIESRSSEFCVPSLPRGS